MSKEKHGLLGKLIKIIMITIFTLIGVTLIVLCSICIAWNHFPEYPWVPIVDLVLGCLLLTSPFFLNKKREGLAKVLKIIIAILFVLIGIMLIVGGSLAIVNNLHKGNNALPICNIVFGCLLFTSPYFLKK